MISRVMNHRLDTISEDESRREGIVYTVLSFTVCFLVMAAAWETKPARARICWRG